MSKEQQVQAMLTAALTGNRVSLDDLVRVGQDRAVLEALLYRMQNHLTHLRGWQRIQEHRVGRYAPGGDLESRKIDVPMQGRDMCSDLEKTVLVAGPIGANLVRSGEWLGTAAFIFLCASRRWVLVVEGHSVTEYGSVDELMSVLSKWENLMVGRYRSPRENFTKHHDLIFESVPSLPLVVIKGLLLVIRRSNALRETDAKHGKDLENMLEGAIGRITTT